jgi:hypothetical protein
MFRIMCASCGAKTTEESFLLARSQAEFHAKETNHWGKVLFWKIVKPGATAGRVRVVYQWGTCYLENRKNFLTSANSVCIR